MELEIQQRINREQSHQLAMQKAMADAASTMTVYQKHVVNTRNQTVEAHDNHESDTDSEDDENVCEEEEALKQQLRSLDKDIKVLSTDSAAVVTEIEKVTKSFNFRQTWAIAEFGEGWQGGPSAPSAPASAPASAPSAPAAEHQAASKEKKQ